MHKAGGILSSTLWAAVAALAVLLSMVMAVPLFTVPRLKQTFHMVAPDYHGSLTRALFRMSDMVHDQWAVATVVAAGACGLVLWSFPNLCGSARTRPIGRASCGAEVCQDVWISVVAGSIKKNELRT